MSKKTPFKIIIALIVLVASIFIILATLFFIQDRERKQQLSQAQQQLSALNDQAQMLDRLDFSASTPIMTRTQARQTLTELDHDLTLLASESAHLRDPDLAPQIAQLHESLPALGDKLNGLRRLDPDQTPFYHLRLALPEFTPTQINIVDGGEQAFFVDQNHHRGLLLNLNSKRFQPYALMTTHFPPSTSQTTFYQLSGNALYSAKFNTPEQVFARPLLPVDFTSQVKHFLSSSTQSYFFTSDKVYKVNNPSFNSSDSPTEPALWLNQGQILPDVNLISDIVVNDNLWLATQEGYIYRLSAGKVKQLEFPAEPRLSPANLVSTATPLRLALSPDDSNLLFVLAPTIGHLYVLDLAKSEIIIDFEGPQLQGSLDLAFNSAENSILVLSPQGAIYQLPL